MTDTPKSTGRRKCTLLLVAVLAMLCVSPTEAQLSEKQRRDLKETVDSAKWINILGPEYMEEGATIEWPAESAEADKMFANGIAKCLEASAKEDFETLEFAIVPLYAKYTTHKDLVAPDGSYEYLINYSYALLCRYNGHFIDAVEPFEKTLKIIEKRAPNTRFHLEIVQSLYEIYDELGLNEKLLELDAKFQTIAEHISLSEDEEINAEINKQKERIQEFLAISTAYSPMVEERILAFGEVAVQYDNLNDLKFALDSYDKNRKYYDINKDYSTFFSSIENDIRYLRLKVIANVSEGDIGEGILSMSQLDLKIDIYMSVLLREQTEAQRIGFWNNYLGFSSSFCYPYILTKAHNIYDGIPEADELLNYANIAMFSNLLHSKGMLLNPSVTMADLVAESGDEKMINEYRQLSEAKANVAVNDGARKMELTKREKELLDNLRSNGDIMSWVDVGIDSIRSVMGDNDIAIEMFAFTDEGEDYHGAMITDIYCEAPQYVPIDDDTVNGLLTRENPDAAGFAFWSKIIDTVSVTPGDSVNIYFSAAGAFHNLAIENFGLELLRKYYQVPDLRIYRVSSTREVALRHRQPNPQKAPVFVGDIDYAGINEQLNYSKDEILGLQGAKIFAKAPVALTGGTATKSQFKSLDLKDVPILHISTHGFFENSGNSQADYENSALLLAPEPGGAPESAYFYAPEIARLDLRGVGLTVLSACHTGSASADPEGAYGLQRAFKKAGAGALLMTTKAVDDKLASEFTTLFYEALANSANTDTYSAFHTTLATFRKAHPERADWDTFMLLDALPL